MITKVLIWQGPGFYVPLNFGRVQRWVLVNSNRACNANDSWSWFESEQSAKIWLGLEKVAATDGRKENMY